MKDLKPASMCSMSLVHKSMEFLFHVKTVDPFEMTHNFIGIAPELNINFVKSFDKDPW